MKLIFITNNFPPISCGVGDYTYHLAKEFVTNGYEVHVICRSHPDIAAQWSNNPENIVIHPIGGNWKRADWSRVLHQIGNIAPTHVLFQYVPGAYNKYAVPWNLIYFFKCLNGLPVMVVTTFHEIYIRYNFAHLKYLYVALGQRLVAKYIAKKSHNLITSIDRYASILKPWNEKVSIIPIGSNIPPIPVAEDEIRELRFRLAPNGERIICTFGSRNHEPLINIFRELLVQDSELVLLIIGNLNGHLNMVPDKIRSKIIITGFLESRKVYKHLKCANLFFNLTNLVHKSGASNKSGSLAAAFAAGLPIVGFMGHLTNKLLLKHSNMVYVSSNVTKESLLKISQILNSKAIQKELSQHSLTFYKEFLSWKKIKLEYQRVLDNYE